ncbi:hypothetical protein UFOVP84_20 [uncultured Caudovirales phage]|uniref:Uncharacterized protein n=1 Tax=uncultured Caudovirales phage TaxID=2100421 RepID=A0A6J5KWE3_9CAUD|nr:hypothetical protein UFOVP84_20 [uncultured Caudovirales phage]
MFSDHINVKGDVHIEIYDSESGIKKHQFDINNLIVSAGKQWIAGRLASSGTSITHMAIGTNTSTPTADNTSLLSQLGSRVAITSNVYVSGNNFITINASFPGSTYASSGITEAGLFTSSTGATAICRTTFGAFAILPTDTIAITWKLSIL